MEWAQVLVIILSSALAVFLALAIALMVLLIKVTRQIQSVPATAERTAQKFETAATNAATFTSPIALAKIVKSFIQDHK